MVARVAKALGPCSLQSGDAEQCEAENGFHFEFHWLCFCFRVHPLGGGEPAKPLRPAVAFSLAYHGVIALCFLAVTDLGL